MVSNDFPSSFKFLSRLTRAGKFMMIQTTVTS
nr:MAG TPA: hypothetical protein [Caudoviricetes sp.]DAP97897.1 MAG TPA: hypothetical protein [Caudoviricetes sp.]